MEIGIEYRMRRIIILAWLVCNISFTSVFSRTREKAIYSSVGSVIFLQLSKAKYFTVRYTGSLAYRHELRLLYQRRGVTIEENRPTNS